MSSCPTEEESPVNSPEEKSRILQCRSNGVSRRARLASFASAIFKPKEQSSAEKVAPTFENSRDFYLSVAESTLCFEVFGMLNTYPWFDALLDEVIDGKLHFSHLPTSVKLSEYDREVAKAAGQAFAVTLITHSQSANGVAEWILQCEGLRELDQVEISFRPALEAIGAEVLKKSSWGVSLRAAAGAIISISDLASDLVMMFAFYAEGRTQYGNATLLMISICFGLQLIMITINKYDGGLKVLGIEFVILFSGLKPAFDAYMLASGQEQKPYAAFDPFTELTGARMIELFAENIPMCILQVMSILDSRSVSATVLTSLTISCLCAGYSSGTVTLDFDISPIRRKAESTFYGAVPDSVVKRLVMLSMLVLQSALLLTIRSTAFAFLIFLGQQYLWTFLACDLGLFFLYKIARNDFLYWAPVSGAAGVLCAFIMRTVLKVVTDFTAIMQFRHPQELGGMYWTFNIFVAISSSVAAMELYLNSLKDNDEKDDELSSAVRMIVFGLAGAWAMLFVASLFAMQPGYARTFFDLRTAAQFKLDQWNEEMDDATRLHCLVGINPHLLRLIDEEDIVVFLRKRTEWEADAVDFWDEGVEATIDPRYLR